MWASKNNINIGDKIEWYRKDTNEILQGTVVAFNNTHLHGFSEFEPIVDDNGSLLVIPYSIIIRKF